MGSETRRLVGVSLKLYLGYAQTERWLAAVADLAPRLPDDALFVLPSTPALPAARWLLTGTGVRYGTQNVHFEQAGPYTGEVSAGMVAELGASFVEVGHAERREHFGETDEIVARKMAAIAQAELTAVLCVGERERVAHSAAEAEVAAQLHSALAGYPRRSPLIVAYEPVWAIGADDAASATHVLGMTAAIRAVLARHGCAARVLYGGSAGPGVFTEFARVATSADQLPDGLFLGRSAHDISALRSSVEEVLAAPEPPVVAAQARMRSVSK